MNHQKTKVYFIAVLSILFSLQIFAQYPKITKEVQKEYEAMMADMIERSDSAWEMAWPVIMEEIKNGKPYVPWAARPTDLPQADIPAFPGAEGGGMYTFGGRGGKVEVVTNLNDHGPGSFRAACEQGGARIIVFNVAGIIRLETPVYIRAPYVTIAGQTAPGDGICIAGETVEIRTHDVIIRHVRFRRGETWVGSRNDAIGGHPVGNIIIDHVSASWGLDENMSLYRHAFQENPKARVHKLGTVNITIQNSIFSEALDTYNHSFGSTLGGENCSFIRNLWANNTGRNPSIGWNGIFNLSNNVIYNWMHRSVDGGDFRSMYNIINNYFKPGPVTPKDKTVGYRILKPETRYKVNGRPVYGRVYVSGNIMEGYDNVTEDNWKGVQIEDMPDAGDFIDEIKYDEPFPMPYFTIMETKDAYEYVLDNAGANVPKRDPVDTRVIKQVRTNIVEYPEDNSFDTLYQFEHRRLDAESYKLGIITDICQVGGYPEYKGEPVKDTDMDGMPDKWEEIYGLNPNDPADANGDINGDGYTNIEKYINGIDPTKKVDWTDLNNNIDTLKENGLMGNK